MFLTVFDFGLNLGTWFTVVKRGIKRLQKCFGNISCFILHLRPTNICRSVFEHETFLQMFRRRFLTCNHSLNAGNSIYSKKLTSVRFANSLPVTRSRKHDPAANKPGLHEFIRSPSRLVGLELWKLTISHRLIVKSFNTVIKILIDKFSTGHVHL